MTRADVGFWLCIAMTFLCGIAGHMDQAASYSAAAVAISTIKAL